MPELVPEIVNLGLAGIFAVWLLKYVMETQKQALEKSSQTNERLLEALQESQRINATHIQEVQRATETNYAAIQMVLQEVRELNK